MYSQGYAWTDYDGHWAPLERWEVIFCFAAAKTKQQQQCKSGSNE
jgi:hypothetical protein